jgi:phthalate 4,5-dioxygenase
MALARVEGNGIRCIFHGWKFDVDGRCVDMPTAPPELREATQAKVPVRRYPTHEAGGIVWVYLGTKATPPAFPDYEFTVLPESQVTPMRAVLNCNWLQGLEALLDSAHVSYLHTSNLNSAEGRRTFESDADYMMGNGAPIFDFVETKYGFREGALRDQGDGKCYARIREVSLPFFSFIPQTPGKGGQACCSIPIDDEHTAQWYILFNPNGPVDDKQVGTLWRTSGDPNHFNKDMGDISNLWGQDRGAMNQGHWSGIVGRGNAYEDFMVQESMGPIVDRSQEFLSTCDHVIVRARSNLLRAVRAFQETGRLSFVDDVAFDRIRAISVALSNGTDWRAVDAFNPPQLETA